MFYNDFLSASASAPSINVGGGLMTFDRPRVMGIVNITPDSFYADSRASTAAAVEARVRKMLDDGADIIDIGGCSTRPGAADVAADEEYSRLARALEVIRDRWPQAVVSVDTYRAGVARKCVEEWHADIINDISGGGLSEGMWSTVAALGVPYVLMHMRGTPATMQTLTDYDDVTAEVLEDLARKLAGLRLAGVRDVIVDPGFGFAKTVGQNYELLARLGEFRRLGAPLLAGMSHKSMLFRPLGITPAEAADATVAAHTIAMLNGADIVRVHDVLPAVQSARIVAMTRSAACRDIEL